MTAPNPPLLVPQDVIDLAHRLLRQIDAEGGHGLRVHDYALQLEVALSRAQPAQGEAPPIPYLNLLAYAYLEAPDDSIEEERLEALLDLACERLDVDPDLVVARALERKVERAASPPAQAAALEAIAALNEAEGYCQHYLKVKIGYDGEMHYQIKRALAALQAQAQGEPHD